MVKHGLVFASLVLLFAPAGRSQELNLAPLGIASQSSIASGGLPARAIDGSFDGLFNNGHVSHTNNLANSWWEVTLPALLSIDEIRLTNRSDCCGARLSNFRLSVFAGTLEVFGQDFFTTAGSVPQGGTLPVLLPLGTVGDRVHIQILGMNNNADGVLSLAEVEVIQYGLVPEFNLARFGDATQSTTSNNAPASRAIDGNRDGYWPNGSVTHTTNTPGNWWQVALPSRARIDEIRIFNRTECCVARLSNFRLSVFDGATEVFGQNFYTAGGNVPVSFPEIVFPTPGTEGDRVLITMLGNNSNGDGILSLAEVEVIRYDPGLATNTPSIATSTGGSQTFQIRGGVGLAGTTYLVAGSASGSAPGTMVGAFVIPLVFDQYFWLTVAVANSPTYSNSFASLDARGFGEATFTLPPGLTILSGLRFHHACALFDSAGQLVGATNATALDFVP